MRVQRLRIVVIGWRMRAGHLGSVDSGHDLR
jgi:hypothetical protein